MTIRVHVFNPDTGKVRSGGVRLASQTVADERLSMWVDLQGVARFI